MKTLSLFKLCFSVLLLSVVSFSAIAQNRTSAYMEFGTPTPVGRFNYGVGVETSMRASSIVDVYGGLRFANQYPSGFGSVKVGATIFLDKKSKQWSFDNSFCFSNYAPYPMNEFYYKLMFAWETKHFRIDAGNAFAFFAGSGVIKCHLWRPSFCFKGSIREKDSSWNIDFFIRNFNRFEAYGSRGIEWGGNISATVAGKWRLFCEPYIFTVGNFSGTATFYNFNCLIGGAYVW